MKTKTQIHKLISLGLLTTAASFFTADVMVAQTLVTKDKVASRVGVFRGGSGFTLGGGGHTAAATDRAADFGMGTGPVYVQDASFIRALGTANEMTVAFWAKIYNTPNNSAVWINSPSSGGNRGFQAHVPWSNNRIYFDTSGCCAETQRIDQDIAMSPGYTDPTWWNSWHFFVFTKKAGNKEIWVDGQFFWDQLNAHPGFDAAPLATDFTDMYIGANGTGGDVVHGMIDDFCIFGTALSPSSINLLVSGTPPNALPASDKLTAWWDFNDFPAEGAFVSIKPAANSTTAAPNLIEIVHTDGDVPWTVANVTLKVDGATVTPGFVRDGNKVTLTVRSHKGEIRRIPLRFVEGILSFISKRDLGFLHGRTHTLVSGAIVWRICCPTGS